MSNFEELETFHDCITLEELQQKKAELAAARENNAARKTKFNSSKTKPALARPAKIIKHNWLQSTLDFLTK